MNVSAAIPASGKLSSRFPNSIVVFSDVCPAERTAMRLALLHLGVRLPRRDLIEYGALLAG